MTNKNEVIQSIKFLAKKKEISREEVITAFNSGAGPDNSANKRFGITEILYYIGGAIVFLGIAILVGQNWNTLGIITKILVTLGSGIAAYVVGLIFSKDKRTEAACSAFFLISALVTPIGLHVVFNNAGMDTGSPEIQSLTSAILFITFLLSFFVIKKTIFALFSIIFGTWLYFAFTNLIINGSPTAFDWNLFEYRALVASISYVLLGYSFSKNKLAPLTGFLYGFGVLTFLSVTLALGGWTPTKAQNIFWESIYPGLIFGVLFLSTYLKSRSFLVFGAIFLIAYIFKITAEYFSQSFGWPIALVFAGLGLIGSGFLFVYLQKKYFVKRN